LKTREVVMSIRVVQVQVLLFNVNLSTTVYLAKLMALLASIIGGFGALKLMDNNAHYAAAFGLMFFEANFIYNIMFDKAWRIPAMVEEVKMAMIAQSSSCEVEAEKEELKKVVRSIQKLGIQAGAFNVMERESTLIFTDFSVQQIVDLTLTF
jgi:hypothetical protein